MNVESAMMFAMKQHKGQVRKYTGEPYVVHLAEVAGLAYSVTNNATAAQVAWLHDVVEDCHVSHETLREQFGLTVADAVLTLSDIEEGNRVQRKKAQRVRLASANWWVQSIKCADVYSNAKSIKIHDQKFWSVYRDECSALLDVLKNADTTLMRLARESLE
jgi:(p)ppGpp synthase/HD superfamily hydrolase